MLESWNVIGVGAVFFACAQFALHFLGVAVPLSKGVGRYPFTQTTEYVQFGIAEGECDRDHAVNRRAIVEFRLNV